MNQARSDFADATPPAGQPKLGEFLKKAGEDRSDRPLRPRATMPQPPLPSSGTSATSAVPCLPSRLPSRLRGQLRPRTSRQTLSWPNLCDRCNRSNEGPRQTRARIIP